MSHNCNCHNDHDHCGHNHDHGNNYYFFENGCGYRWSFCESDGAIVGTLFLILGIIIIVVEAFG